MILMGIDTIAMQAVPRRRTHPGNGTAKSLLDPHYIGEEVLSFSGALAGPRRQHDRLYVKAFKTAIDDAAEDRIKVTTHKPAPYELCIRARNLDTGREIRLRATFVDSISNYVASVQKAEGTSSTFLNSLRSRHEDVLMRQYRLLIKRLYNHIRTS